MGQARLASSLLAALCLQVVYVSATTSAGVGVQAEVLWNRKGGGCKPGRYGKQCKQCPPGYYSPDGSHCKRCDELLTTMRSGSTSPAECTVKGCPAGTFKPTNSFECAPCEVGTYSLGGYPYPTKCEPCPDGRMTIGKGADNKDQCVCEPGFGRAYGEADTCERCPVGTYNYGDAFDECKVCIPPKTTTHAGATSDKDCVCPSGAGSGIDCDQCPANMILLDEGLCGCLPGHGGSECDKCEPGFYSPGGSAEVPRPPCKPCGLYFTSPAGAVSAEYCQCKAGFGADEYDDRHCAVCPLGTFNPGLSADAAISVSIAATDKTRHLRPRASPCFECGAAHFGGSFTTFQVGSKSPSDCMCNPGYGGIGCSICAKGTYSEGGKDALCQLCPNGGAGYITDEGATTPAACVCLPGYGTGESGFCGLCPANTFGPGGNKNQCEPCPAGTESAPGATCKEECVPVKTLCPAGTELYWNETYGNRGPTLKDCKCKPGYGSATGEGICALCGVGTFSPGGTMEDCRPCDFGTTSAAGSTSQDSCRAVAQRCPIGQCAPDNAVSEKECHCYEGFGGGNTPDEACTICPAGTYSANKGTEKCLPCAAGYTSLEGATEEDECFLSDTCPAGTEPDTTYNGQLTNSCVCKAGYGSSTGEPLCKQCPIGTYAEGGNLEDCLACPFGTTSAAGSSSKDDCVPIAQACPVGQIAPPDAVSKDQCVCKAGYGGGATPKDACSICAVGTWAPGNSTQPCVPCGFGYTGPEGAYKREQCVKTNACPAGTEYDGEDYDDRSRPDGEHKPKGLFSTADCVCKAGYGSATGEPGGVCRRCPAGTFSDGGDMDDCKSCPFGFTSREGAKSWKECERVAQRCPIGQFAPKDAVSEKQCRCYEGFGGGNTPDEACTICPAGTYSANKGTEKCLPCAAGYTSREGATEEGECFLSHTCPAGTELDKTYNGTMAHNCVCKAGYGSCTGEPLCKQCPIGTYAEGGNLEDCLACPFGTTSAAGSSSKYDCVPIAQACPVGQIAPPGAVSENQCVCKAGYGGGATPKDACSICAVGTWAPGNSTQPCIPCGFGYTGPEGAFKREQCVKTNACPAGTEYDGEDYDDRSRPDGEHKPKGPFSTADCVCKAGYGSTTGEPGGVCRRCPAGTFSNGGDMDDCKSCPFGFTSREGAKSWKECERVAQRCPIGQFAPKDAVSEKQCRCYEGFGGGNTPDEACTICPAGTYSANQGTEKCLPCAAGYTGLEGATEEGECFLSNTCPAGTEPDTNSKGAMANSCVCKAGYGSSNGEPLCKQCPIGTYAEGGNLEDCLVCPFGTTSAAGSSSKYDCVPIAQVCPVGQIAPPDAVSEAQCACKAGYGGGATPKDACSICAVGTWAPGNSTQPCIPCGFGYTGPEGAYKREQCVKTNACPAGTEYDGEDYDDRSRPDGGHKPKGPFSTADCVCKAGYGSATGEPGGVCRRCPAGTFSDGGDMDDCKSCPFGFTSREGALSWRECEPVAQRCPIGQFAPDDAVSEKQCRCYEGFGGGSTPDEACTICPAGTYSANQGTEKCLPCAAGYTSLEGATEEDECFLSDTCPAGTEPDTFYYGGTPYNGETTYDGHGTKRCVCKAGYGSSTGEPLCKQCPIGTYAEGGNLEDCLACPFGTTSAAGSSSKYDCVPIAQACHVGQIAPPDAVSKDQCVCKAGYGGGATPKDACSICAVGTWAPGNSTQPCIPCGFGYTGPEGAYKREQCVETNACPAGTEYDGEDYDDRSRPDGEHKPKGLFSTADCVCKAGYGSATGGSGGVCRRCPAGTFSDGGDMDDCKSCPFGFTSREGAKSWKECERVAQRCPIGQFAPGNAVSEKQCRCYEGFGGGNTPDEACTICPAGTHSANQGTEKCLPCAAGYTSLAGAKNQSECFAVDSCPAGTEIPADKVSEPLPSCVCRPGFGSCTGEGICSLCPIGTYSEGGSMEDCKPCQFGLTSAAGSNSSSQCVPVAQACPVGQIAPPDAVSEAQCACKAGYGGGATPKDACSICAVATWAPGNSTQPCVPCGFGYTGPEGAYKREQCVKTNACPAGTEYVNGDHDDDRSRLDYPKPKGPFSTADCVCKAGYGSATGETGGVCRRCPAGTFSDGGDRDGCKSCPFGFTSCEGASSSRECEPVAQRCPIGQFAPKDAVSEKQCRCYEGFGGGNTPDEACTICPAGTYSANQGTEKCLPCQFGYTSLEGAKNRSECFAVDSCPAGTEVRANGAGCVCRPGFGSKTGEGICSLCPIGTYSEGGSMEDCKPCDFGLTSAAGSNSRAQCVPVSQACPVGQIAPPGAVSAAQCVCIAGYGGGATPQHACSICRVGFWAPGTDTQPCIPCGWGYTSPEGSCSDDECIPANACPAGTEYYSTVTKAFSFEDCVCKPGFGSFTGKGVCHRCPAGTFSAGGTMESCESCGEGWTSDEGAVSRDDCFTYDDDAKADSYGGYGGYGSNDDDGAYSSLQAREGSFRALDVNADIPLGAGGVNARFVRPEHVKPSTPLPATRQLSPVTAVKPQPRRPVSPQQPRPVAVTRPTAPKPAPVVSRKPVAVTPPAAPKPANVVAPRPVAVTRPTAPKPLALKPVAVTPPPAPQPAGSTTHKQPLAANTPSQQQARAQSRRLQML